MPYYAVTVIASVSTLVQANDEDEATKIAFEEASFDLAEVKETSPARLLDEAGIASMRRHADQIIE